MSLINISQKKRPLNKGLIANMLSKYETYEQNHTVLNIFSSLHN